MFQMASHTDYTIRELLFEQYGLCLPSSCVALFPC